eukprot:5590376-Prymnesium_polylepis.1
MKRVEGNHPIPRGRPRRHQATPCTSGCARAACIRMPSRVNTVYWALKGVRGDEAWRLVEPVLHHFDADGDGVLNRLELEALIMNSSCARHTRLDLAGV